MSQATENEEDSNKYAPTGVEVEYEIQDLRRQLNKSIALARELMGVEGEGMGKYHIEGIVKGKVTDVTDTQRATTTRTSVRQAGLKAKGVTAIEHWDSERGGASMYPLRPAADPHYLEYQPWKMTDLTTLMEQMPSLHGGASAWLLQLQTLTSGLDLCLGDMKALLARATNHGTMNGIMTAADLGAQPPTLPLDRFRTVLWDELRRAYPTERNHATLSSFTINPGEHPAEYLDRAKSTWRSVHDEPFDHTDTTLNMWKEMVVNGCPGDVKTKLRGTVGLIALPLTQFNAHVHHHVGQHNKDRGGSENQVQSLQVQLLKLQLKEAQKGEKT